MTLSIHTWKHPDGGCSRSMLGYHLSWIRSQRCDPGVVSWIGARVVGYRCRLATLVVQAFQRRLCVHWAAPRPSLVATRLQTRSCRARLSWMGRSSSDKPFLEKGPFFRNTFGTTDAGASSISVSHQASEPVIEFLHRRACRRLQAHPLQPPSFPVTLPVQARLGPGTARPPAYARRTTSR